MIGAGPQTLHFLCGLGFAGSSEVWGAFEVDRPWFVYVITPLQLCDLGLMNN